MAHTEHDFFEFCLEGTLNLLALHQRSPQRYPFLLQSVAGHQGQGRYDVLFFRQGDCLVRYFGDGADRGFLCELERLWQAARAELNDARAPAHLPFSGGWFLHLGYELAQEIEPKLELPRPLEQFPMAFACRCPAAIIVDHQQDCTYLVAEPGREKLLESMRQDLEAGDVCEFPQRRLPWQWVEGDSGDHYEAGVKRCLDYILAGDVFQVNLSRGWRGAFSSPVDAGELYQRLCESNPAPFSGLLRWGDGALISSSPERLVSVRDGMVETRPIAGTRPRSSDPKTDAALIDELLAHPKEQAEHIMLIDLERNDLGRVCEPGSVEVNELMVLESYAHVHHIVSNVRGQLRSGISPSDVIRAVFPGGTITGAPKVRCMEIIAELEQVGRNCYTGSCGYLNHSGDMDLNILIRSLLLEGDQVSFRTGAGIVADSDPTRELHETRSKAKGLLIALDQDVSEDAHGQAKNAG